MSVDEALMQAQGSKDAFLVFRDARSQRVSVLYRRPDGNFGLIEPEA
jgi:putative sigma-54 modulation protein